MPGLKVAVSDDLCKKKLPSWRHTLQVSNSLFCAIETVGKKYDISVDTMENLSHAFLFYLAENQRNQSLK
jgi:hypothetical protein